LFFLSFFGIWLFWFFYIKVRSCWLFFSFFLFFFFSENSSLTFFFSFSPQLCATPIARSSSSPSSATDCHSRNSMFQSSSASTTLNTTEMALSSLVPLRCISHIFSFSLFTIFNHLHCPSLGISVFFLVEAFFPALGLFSTFFFLFRFFSFPALFLIPPSFLFAFFTSQFSFLHKLILFPPIFFLKKRSIIIH